MPRMAISGQQLAHLQARDRNFDQGDEPMETMGTRHARERQLLALDRMAAAAVLPELRRAQTRLENEMKSDDDYELLMKRIDHAEGVLGIPKGARTCG